MQQTDNQPFPPKEKRKRNFSGALWFLVECVGYLLFNH